ncbi:MAG: hypothetical protein NZT92_19390, partial [Abditibacteriales bacterium]|nr:hypothetical protein [Abditibacteriales bacterium]
LERSNLPTCQPANALRSLWEYARTLDDLRARAEARAEAVESRRLVRYVDGLLKRLRGKR